ncbi:unnamed protein product [Lactuca virosa]|uniref:Uncharacterized protein n=1 Tax=Lactuca virosa TaxID=75947 RepID=A0AAU9MRB3_9ASTR|nr:unnamed protein product [Lactuca virosa]
MQLIRSFQKLSSFLLTGNDVRSTSSPSPPVIKPGTTTLKTPNSRHFHGLEGGGSSSFIKIQGNDHRDIRISDDDDASWCSGMLTSELKTSVTNLEASDYIRRFHERNKHEYV